MSNQSQGQSSQVQEEKMQIQLKRNIHDQNIEICSKFAIRPPTLMQPTIKINQFFDVFRVKVTNQKMEKVKCKIPLFGQNSRGMSRPQQKSKKQQKLDDLKEIGDLGGSAQSISSHISSAPRKISLIDCSLFQVMASLFEERLMPFRYFENFNKNYSQNAERRVIQAGDEKFLKKYIKQIKFFLYDHRVLSEILASEFGQTYEMKWPGSKKKGVIRQKVEYIGSTSTPSELKMFRSMYDKDLSQYLKQWDDFNLKYERKWMPQSKNLMENPYYFREMHDF